MKDEIGKYIEITSTYDGLEKVINNYMDYYNNDVISINLPNCHQMNFLNIIKQEIIHWII